MKFIAGLIAAALAGTAAAAPQPPDNRAIALLWYKAFDQHDATLLDQILAPEWMDIPSPSDTPIGPEGAKGTLRMLTTTFPDFAIKVEDVVQEGDKVVVRSIITGDQQTEFLGIPARGRRVRMQAIDIHQIKDGKIVRSRAQGRRPP